jgi:hypothetical protein
MDVLDAHLRSLSLKEYRDLIKTLKLLKELPKNYSKLPKNELYAVVKPLVKSINDSDKMYINRNSNVLVEIKPREVKSRVKKTQEPPKEAVKIDENPPTKIPKAKKQVPKVGSGVMVQEEKCEPKEEKCEPCSTPRKPRKVKDAVAKIEGKKCC